MGAGRSRSKVLKSVIGGGADVDSDDLVNEPLPDEVAQFIVRDSDALGELTDEDFAPVTMDEYRDMYNRLGVDEVGIRTIFETKMREYSLDELNGDEEAPYRARMVVNTMSNIITKYKDITGDNLLEKFAFVKTTGETMDFDGLYLNGKNTIMITDSAISYFGWATKNKNWNSFPIKGKGVASHELGHAVMYKLQQGSNKSKLEAFNKKVSGTSAVSVYGNSNYMEAFAEAFSLYSHGVSTSLKGGSKYYTEFKKLMKDCGLSDLYGCTK